MPDEPTVIHLALPAAPEFLRLARLAAADAGSRTGFSYEDIEDLRIAVDELCHLLMLPGTERDQLSLTFTLNDHGIVVEGEGPPGASHHSVVQSDLSRSIVAAVVDDHEVGRDGDVMRFRMVKRAPNA